MNMRAFFDRAEDLLFSLFLPQTQCAVCSSHEEIGYGVCSDCLSALESYRLAEGCCPICGLPDMYFVCPDCASAPPAFTRARGAYRYTDAARVLIHLSKFGKQPRVASRAFAQAMAALIREIMPDADCLTPVPLSKRKMLARGYNQSSFLASRISALTGIPVREGLVYRNRNTAQQAELGRDERILNVKGAFTGTARAKNMRVVLVDDVITTCNTASACAEALLRAGAADVCVVAAARAEGRNK